MLARAIFGKLNRCTTTNFRFFYDDRIDFDCVIESSRPRANSSGSFLCLNLHEFEGPSKQGWFTHEFTDADVQQGVIRTRNLFCRLSFFIRIDFSDKKERKKADRK